MTRPTEVTAPVGNELNFYIPFVKWSFRDIKLNNYAWRL